MENNCLECLYSETDDISILFQDLPGFHNDVVRCKHQNSPYYNELVFDDKTCRLFINAQEYFKLKDRKEYIDELKNKIKGINNKH